VIPATASPCPRPVRSIPGLLASLLDDRPDQTQFESADQARIRLDAAGNRFTVDFFHVHHVGGGGRRMRKRADVHITDHSGFRLRHEMRAEHPDVRDAN